MEHVVEIWSNRKERNKDGNLVFLIEDKITISQEEIEQFALDQFMENHSIDDSREYKAELSKTTH